MTKIPTRREYCYEKPYCLIEHEDCVDCFKSINGQPNPATCSNCQIALEEKNKSEKEKGK